MATSSVVALTVVSLVGCAGPNGVPIGDPGGARRAAVTECGAPSVSCQLPFPSDRWLVADPTTATGLRVEMPPGQVEAKVRNQLGPRDQIDEALAGADGFSPLSPVMFQVPEALAFAPVIDNPLVKDTPLLPSDGGELIAVWDATTGERLRIRAEVSRYRADERGAYNFVLAWPETMWPYGHEIFASLHPGLLAADGSPASASPQLAQSLPRTRALAEQIQPARPFSEYLSMTSFTVRSQASVTADVDRMAALVRAADHPVRNIEVNPSLIGGAAVVSGQLRSTNFGDPDGVIPRQGAATPHDLWIDFMAVLPDRPATAEGAPVVMYGHGITVMKETMLVTAAQNAAKGFATIGIDVPNHGSRQNEGGYLLDLTNPANLGRLDAMLLQGELDQLSLLGAITEHLDTLDVLPRNWLAASGGDGRPDLDTDRVLYQGTSLGGVMGSVFVALAPELDGAYLQVPGSGIIDLLFHSLIWEVFQSVVPVGAPMAETHILLFNSQMMLDRADNAHYLDRIGANGTPLFVVYAVDDGIVPNFSSERMIELSGLPMAGRQFGPLRNNLAAGAGTALRADGRGFAQIPTWELDGSFLEALQKHADFVDPVSMATLDQWLDGRLVEIRAGR